MMMHAHAPTSEVRSSIVRMDGWMDMCRRGRRERERKGLIGRWVDRVPRCMVAGKAYACVLNTF